jgi:protein-S-isoprenylcysteine O-methyltransferase Ste14
MPSEKNVLQLLETQLSFRSRGGHLALLLGATGMSAVIAALLATETALPHRTVVALGTLLAIGASWMAYAAWVLTARRTLLAGHRVIAGRIAVAAATIFMVGALALAMATEAPSAYAASGLGIVMLGIAMAVLVRAKRNHRTLQQRRAELEAQLERG